MSLRPIDASNREAVGALRVSPNQLHYVSSVTDSLLEAVEDSGERTGDIVFNNEVLLRLRIR